MTATTLSPRSWLAIDWIERLGVTLFFGTLVFVRRDALENPESVPFYLLYCLQEGLVVLFILLRRHSSNVTTRATDWTIAILATVAHLFARPGGHPIAPVAVGAFFVLTGIVLQLAAKLTLRRSMGMVAANRGVKVSGPYRMVRHPMYAGYMIADVGLILMSPLLFNAALYGIAWTLQVLRIRAEERLLREDTNYLAYQDQVKYRLVPGIF